MKGYWFHLINELLKSTGLGELVSLIGSLIFGLILIAIQDAIIALVLCGLAKLFADKDLEDTFLPTFYCILGLDILISIFF